MIQLKEIEKVYRTERIETVALADVNLTVREGEFVSIMGPSGCGKSTLLNLMGLLDEPTRGTVQINGSPIDRYSDRALAAMRNKEIGFVFQVFHLVSDLSVLFPHPDGPMIETNSPSRTVRLTSASATVSMRSVR